MYIRPETWIEVIDQEYLSRLVLSGGSAVKFAALLENVRASDVGRRLRDKAESRGYQFAFVSSETTRIHMIEQLFFAVSRQIDWHSMACDLIRKLIIANGYVWSNDLVTTSHFAGQTISLDKLAEINNRVPVEFRRDIHIWIEQALYQRKDMALDFRIAMIRLCASRLDADHNSFTSAVSESILAWLTGELRRISELKAALIYRKITRNNARNMLNSLSVFIKMTGASGLVLHLDISQYLRSRRSDIPVGTLYFTKAAVMDMYEVIRQLIDGTDRQQRCLTLITAPLTLIQDDKRGLNIYQALRDRVMDDVHDRNRANPLAALARLAFCGEPTAIRALSSALSPADYDENILHCMRAVEALRCGIPNEDAVRKLCSFQPHIHKRFEQQLQRLVEHPQQQSPGMIVAGGFGGGKSHLLQYLQMDALKRGFVCSKIVISKETPLFDPVKLFAAAMSNLRLPDNHCNDLNTVADRLDPGSDRFKTFKTWLKSERNAMNEQFAATLFLFERCRADTEYIDRIMRFWSGDKLLLSEIKRPLKQLGELQSFHFERVNQQDLALQRFRFAAQLMIAAGYQGWALLLDEAELIGRYSLLQRARSYGRMALLLGGISDFSFEGSTSVIAITDDFQSAVIDEKNDLEKVPNRLLARDTESDRLLAGITERCMLSIQQDRVMLRPPDNDVINRAREQLRDIYRTAYNWMPTKIAPGDYLSSTRMRHFIKRWITEWDLNRFYPDYIPDITADEFTTVYSENRELESPSEDAGSDDDYAV